MIDTNQLSDTQRDILSHCRYGYWLATFQQRYYSRMNALLNFLQVALGAAVFGTVFNGTSQAQAAGVATMLIGALQLIIPFGENAAIARQMAHHFSSIEGEIPTLDEKVAADRVRALQEQGLESFHAMEVLAMNRVCDWHHAPQDKMPMTLGAHIIKIFL